jgi:hypothetical protein
MENRGADSRTVDLILLPVTIGVLQRSREPANPASDRAVLLRLSKLNKGAQGLAGCSSLCRRLYIEMSPLSIDPTAKTRAPLSGAKISLVSPLANTD